MKKFFNVTSRRQFQDTTMMCMPIDRGNLVSDEYRKPFITTDHLEWTSGPVDIICNNNELGVGAYGRVYQGKMNEKDVAIKISRSEYHKSAKLEAELIGKLPNHSCVIEILSCFLTRKGLQHPIYPVSVFPLYGESLYIALRASYKARGEPLLWEETRNFLHDGSAAIAHCAQNGISHLDVKPENFMRKGKNNWVLGDFNCAQRNSVFLPWKKDIYVVSRFYRPPEIILQLEHSGESKEDPKIDVWSFGCVVAEIITGDPLFYPVRNSKVLQVMEKVLGLIPREMIEDHLKKFKYASDLCECMFGHHRVKGKHQGDYETIENILSLAEEEYVDKDTSVLRTVFSETLVYLPSDRICATDLHEAIKVMI